MLWVFLIIALASVSFSVTIILQHMNEATGLLSRLEDVRAGRAEAERQMEQARLARDQAKQQAGQITESIGKLQVEADELNSTLNQRRQERERRGKFKVG